MTDHKQAPSEEDFLDYEERDVRDGWPYADSDDARRAGQNTPYGTPGAGPDRVENEGIQITSGPTGRDVEGGPVPFAENMHEAIADDDLEARVLEVLDRDGRFDLQMLNLTIRDGVAELEGAVDSQDERRQLIGFLRRVRGVRDVRAGGLLTYGVDSHAPRDVAE